MPIYEFYCPDNHKIYQFLARSLRHQGSVPRCPDNEKYRMERRVSRFALLRGLSEDQENDPFANVGESKMEALMAEMERDMSGMDDENPNPKQLGHIMRRMTDVMGDKVPAEMREMVRRLEAGEDPEKLEADYGSLMGDEEGGGEGEEGSGGPADFFSQTVKKLRTNFRPPQRDPKLYEISEFVAEA